MGFFFRLYLYLFSPDKEFIRSIRNIVGYTPTNLTVFRLAFQHSSVAEEAGMNNERLEFLGDAVLDAIVGEYLFLKYPYKDEGFLTEMRSKMVSRNQLRIIGMKLGLEELLQYNQADKFLKKSSIIGNCLEALIGAVYLDTGYRQTRRFVNLKIIKPFLDVEILEKEEFNFKSKLIEWAQKEGKTVVFEELAKEEHQNLNLYTMGVKIDGDLMGTGKGYNKKSAEQMAAEVALQRLEDG